MRDGTPFAFDGEGQSGPSQSKRWIVSVVYRSGRGPATVTHHIEELAEIHDLIEQGPDWNCIADLKIALNPARRHHNLTIEGARLL